MSEKITVGILKERDKSENRVSLVPRDVNLLIKMGLSVELENGAGEKAGFLNKDYENVGTKVRAELLKSGIMAIALALVSMLLYI